MKVVGANRRAARIDITLPVDEAGDYAFDEDGDPIKGKKPLVITVPRFDCMERDQFKALNKELTAIEDKKDEDGKPLSNQDRAFEVVLAMVRPFVSDTEVAVIGKLHLFELEQIADFIQQRSTISVGELLASTNS